MKGQGPLRRVEPTRGSCWAVSDFEDREQSNLPKSDGILINAEDVQWVEFVRPDEKADEKRAT